MTWLVLSSSSVVSSCRVLSSLVLVPARSEGVLESLLGTSGGTSWGLWERSGGLVRPILALLTALDPPGPFLGRSWASPGPSWGALGAYLGRSWQLLAALGPRLGRPGAGGSLRRSWRLPGGSWGPLGGSKVAFCRKAEFRRQYSVFHGFLGVREASWRLLGLSWSPRGGPWGPPGGSWAALSALGWLLGGSWQGPVGPGWFLGGPGLVPEWARGRRTSEGSGNPYVFIV